MKSAPWTQFAVGAPSTRSNWTEPDCSPFENVAHVTHSRFALDILRDRVLRPRLVFDECKLNDRRILVNWLSPNHWTIGYRYGNIRMSYPINTLIKDMNIYWVEVANYEIKAPRILISHKTYSASSGLVPYDPKTEKGPWWHDSASDIHYFNGTYCLELLVERELNLADFTQFAFVDHSTKFCSINRKAPKLCRELGRSAGDAGRIFLASAVSQRLGGAAEAASSLVRLLGQNDLEWQWESLRNRLQIGATRSRGTLTHGQPASSVVSRAILLAVAQEDVAEAESAILLFVSNEEAIEACATLVESTLGLSPKSLPREQS